MIIWSQLRNIKQPFLNSLTYQMLKQHRSPPPLSIIIGPNEPCFPLIRVDRILASPNINLISPGRSYLTDTGCIWVRMHSAIPSSRRNESGERRGPRDGGVWVFDRRPGRDNAINAMQNWTSLSSVSFGRRCNAVTTEKGAAPCNNLHPP